MMSGKGSYFIDVIIKVISFIKCFSEDLLIIWSPNDKCPGLLLALSCQMSISGHGTVGQGKNNNGDQKVKEGNEQNSPQQSGDRPGWQKLPEETLPRPTYIPAVMAFSITLIAFGFVTTIYISIIGFIFFILSLAGWIGEFYHEN